MKHSHTVFVVSTLVAGITAFSNIAVAASGADYFKGKTITWIVGSAPGGGHDYFARLLSRHMERFLPDVTIAVKNRPGAGHIIAANLIYNAKPNGLTIGSFTTGLVYSQVQKKKGIRFDLAKMSWIGKAQSDWRVLSVTAKNTEFKTINDVLNSKRKVKFSASGLGAGSYNDAFMFGTSYKLPYRIIVGYSGSQAPLGMLRGETDILMGGMSSGLQYVRAGQLKIILQFGKVLKGVPDARDIAKTPTQIALSNMMENQGKLARISAGPPAIPADRLAALRGAYKAAVNSKKLIAEAKTAHRDVDPLVGEDVRKAIVAILNQPPEILAMLTNLSKQKVASVKHTGPVTKIKRKGRQVWINFKGKEVGTKISGSRTKITVGGKKAKRKKIKIGMTCTFTYPRPGAESQNVDCK